MTALTDRQKEFCGYFIAAGYPMRSSAAIGGNGTRENKCLPVTEGVLDHESNGSLQWRRLRLANLKSLPNWDTLKTQAQFTILELQAKPGTQFFDKDYSALEADLRAGAKSLETLTLNFCDHYESPSEAGRVADLRIVYAHDCLAILMRDLPAGPVVASVPMPSIPPLGAFQMPIELILQLAMPLAESLISGLLRGALTHAQQTGTVPAVHPGTPIVLAKDAPAPAPLGLTPADFSQIAAMIEAALAKLNQPKAAA